MKRFKGIMLSAAGLFLCLVYLAGIAGFDIHVDHHEGRTYVVSLLSDTSCEKIHPEDVCHCCHHHHPETASAECADEGVCAEDDDCQDFADYLGLTGDGSDAQHHVFIPVSGAAFNPAAILSGNSRPGVSPSRLQLKFIPPPREHLSRICVLRV